MENTEESQEMVELTDQQKKTIKEWSVYLLKALFHAIVSKLSQDTKVK